MVNFSKYKTLFASGVGVIIGGTAAFYGTNYISREPFKSWDYNWDKRSPESLVKPPKNPNDAEELNRYKQKLIQHTSKAIRHVILIRHGQYNYDGATDAERFLTELGRKQALQTGLRLKELDYPYTKLINSTMTRAIETATLIQKHLPDLPTADCSLLREGAPALPDPVHSSYRPELYKVFQDGARIEAAFRKYIHRAPPEQEHDTFDIVVCHANVIRYFVCRALQLPPKAWLRFSMNNGSITWLTMYPDGKVSLQQYSDAGHMPPAYLTTN